MPITKDDVLKTLNDPALGRISFSLGQIKVNAEEFRKVADCIYAGDITVTSGNDALAYYSSHLNELITQRGNPPLDYTDRAQLLHECTHAIVDINQWSVLRLHDEVAGYLTQMTYSLIADFSPLVPPVLPPGVGSPLGRLVWTVKEVVLRYGFIKRRASEPPSVPRTSPEWWRSFTPIQITLVSGTTRSGPKQTLAFPASTWRWRGKERSLPASRTRRSPSQTIRQEEPL